ncbi:sortase-associated OmpA-like protein PdsO [Algibacillus agarilyticus]|uniref:sortase-associated OmpA-like protein PdsO n=1 Tax=Algibacillus agarilyticus TaxID=2234133 RepID=UPI000DCFDF28|nr:sortase-associated OmpA-like protein PdsO [Algibacillus agarilyticus]
MKKQLITSALLLALTSTSSFANSNLANHDKEEYEKNGLIGFGSGAAIGAIFAGPIGAVAGATIGGIISYYETTNDINDKTIQSTNAALSQAKNQQQTLARNVNQLASTNKQLQTQIMHAEKTLASAEVIEKLKLNLQFTIGSSDVQSIYQDQVLQLSQLAKQNTDLHIQLNGYADRSGEDERNLVLSKQRVNAVKKLLVAQGINAERISTQAYGESAPLASEQTYQNDFFDRRVEIKLVPQAILTAAND